MNSTLPSIDDLPRILCPPDQRIQGVERSAWVRMIRWHERKAEEAMRKFICFGEDKADANEQADAHWCAAALMRLHLDRKSVCTLPVCDCREPKDLEALRAEVQSLREKCREAEDSLAKMTQPVAAERLALIETLVTGDGALERWERRVGVTTIPFLREWAELQLREILMMRSRRETMYGPPKKDLEDFLLGKQSILMGLLANLRQIAEQDEADGSGAAELRQAERWLYDLVNGMASGPKDWGRVSHYCQLHEPKARKITATVLAAEFIKRVAESGL